MIKATARDLSYHVKKRKVLLGGNVLWRIQSSITKLLAVIVFVLVMRISSFAQNHPTSFQIKDFQELRDSMHAQPKYIVLELFTEWCSYCRLQHQQFLKNKKVNQLLSTQFYYIRFDAETQTEVVFNDTIYNYDAGKRVHLLADKLGRQKGELSYPIILLLNPNFQVLFRHQGLLTAETLKKILE